MLNNFKINLSDNLIKIKIILYYDKHVIDIL